MAKKNYHNVDRVRKKWMRSFESQKTFPERLGATGKFLLAAGSKLVVVVRFTFRHFRAIAFVIAFTLVAHAVGIRIVPSYTNFVTKLFIHQDISQSVPAQALPQNGNLVVDNFTGTSTLDVNGSLWQVVAESETDFGKVTSVTFHYSVFNVAEGTYKPVEDLQYKVGSEHDGRIFQANEFVWWFE